jgi:hypothetical protein
VEGAAAADPLEIAEAILFLTSPQSSFLTGAALAVDAAQFDLRINHASFHHPLLFPNALDASSLDLAIVSARTNMQYATGASVLLSARRHTADHAHPEQLAHADLDIVFP